MKQNKTEKVFEQSDWEKSHDKVARGELRRNILGFMDKMSDPVFHSFYYLMWEIASSQTMYESQKLLTSMAERRAEVAEKKGVQ